MADIQNQDPSGKVQDGTILSVTGAESENEAILAVENYLRVNQSEGLEITVTGQGEGGALEVKLEKITA